MHQIISQFFSDVRQTTWLEFIAVIAGIASVIFSRKENILVYPVGMINTGMFVPLYIIHGLYADASVNLYYTIMSIVGWYMWSRKKEGKNSFTNHVFNRKRLEKQSDLFFCLLGHFIFSPESFHRQHRPCC